VEAIDLGNEVEVGVIDTGPGIAPEELPLLFEKFSQTATGKNTATHGTGLGLVICRHLIEAHSGRIWVESQPGQGARFAFRLPLIARQAGASGRQRSILVVDDDARVAGFLADLLTADGHAVEIAVTGEAAIQRLEQRPYDVIVSDIRLPDRDGLGLYREIASRRPTLCSRFVFITGYRLAPETREFLAQTGAPCLSKPFALEELEGFVRRIPLNPAVDEATAR
jgi:CheY-like chemotaxis protein